MSGPKPKVKKPRTLHVVSRSTGRKGRSPRHDLPLWLLGVVCCWCLILLMLIWSSVAFGAEQMCWSPRITGAQDQTEDVVLPTRGDCVRVAFLATVKTCERKPAGEQQACYESAAGALRCVAVQCPTRQPAVWKEGV